jgi:hypothetical protein
LKPDEKLPVFMIEDIKTLYVKAQFEEQWNATHDQTTQKKSRKQLKEEAEEKLSMEKAIRNRVDQEIVQMQKEDFRKNVKKEIELQTKEHKMANSLLIEEKRKEDSIISQKRLNDAVITQLVLQEDSIKVAEHKKIIEKEQLKLDEEFAELKTGGDNEVIELSEKKVETDEPLIIIEETVDKKTEEEVVETKPVVENKLPTKEEVQQELKRKYIKPKTVEVIQAEGRKITKVYINNSESVTVYVKVEHAWGGVYYFIDYYPDEMKSITAESFARNTKLYE